MSTRPAAARYPIRAVAKLTGLPLDTLRAWERRYGAVTPLRDGRQRVYTDADIARLKLLQRAVTAGHTISRAAALSDAELTTLLDAHVPAPARTGRQSLEPDSIAFSRALASMDMAAIDGEFSRLAALLSPAELVRDVLMPSIRACGDAWAQEPGRIAQEHMVSAILRHLMGSFLRLFARRRGTARLLFATPSGERHELCLLGAAMLAASAGTDPAYLGPDLPAAEIVAAATASRARVVVLGLTLPGRDAVTVREVRALVQQLPPGVELWVGGAAAPLFAREFGSHVRVLNDFDAYLAELARIGHPVA